MKVTKNLIAYYLGTKSGDTTTFNLINKGFSSFEESPSAQVDEDQYIADKNGTSSVTGYKNSFAFEGAYVTDDPVCEAIYAVGRDQKTGSEAEFELVVVDLYETASPSGTYPARKMSVCCEVSGFPGKAGEKVSMSGSMHQNGDLTQGTFVVNTKAFTAAS